MNHGFFTPSEMKPSKKRLAFSPQCGACGMHKHCKSPKMSYTGKGKQKILIIGDAPGSVEDERNQQFVGRAGKRLWREIKRTNKILKSDCWVTNAIRCKPNENKTPDSKTIANCRPALFAEIKKLRPKNILLFGSAAAESVLGHLWGGGGKFSLDQWTNWVIPHQELNAWISVHHHPSYLERKQDHLLDLLFRRGLKRALRKRGRPWKELPSFSDEVELLYKPKTIANRLRDIKTGAIAFDYEANCLKPEYKGAKIYSCSVCWDGVETFAFPWTLDVWDERIYAISDLLKSPVKKIASNMKFEERWTRHFLQHPVKNWVWDTMLSAHVLNNATGITGLKFQAFVRLGQAPYDKYIEPYLKSPKGEHINRIDKIPLKDLLVYNGMDSLLEYKLAVIQRKDTQ